MTYVGAPLSSVNQTWGTPVAFFEFLESHFGWIPDLDAAASDHNHKAPVYFTEEQNSLEQKWFGNVWLNPPFGKVLLPQFLEKCASEIAYGNCESIMCLIPARTDTKWWHEIVYPNAKTIFLIKGRFHFDSPYDEDGIGAPFPSMLVHFERGWNSCEIQPLEIEKKWRGWQ